MTSMRFTSVLVPSLVTLLVCASGCGRTPVGLLGLDGGEDAGEVDGGDGGGPVEDGGPRPCRAPADCDDGLFCNGPEVCRDGLCQRGVSPDCTDAIDCTADSCDEDADGCLNLPDHNQCPVTQ